MDKLEYWMQRPNDIFCMTRPLDKVRVLAVY
jgi:hypothetical protein